MESAWTPDPPSTVDIDRNGDVMLVLGPSESPRASLLVSSKVLSIASRVFEVMFGPYFMEGQAMREEKNPAKPLQLPLPDDDPSGVTILCNYLHHRHLSLPKSPSLDLVVEVARVADKYDCAAILRPVVAAWMRPYLFEASAEPQLRDLLALACLFDDAWSFKTVTAQILLANGKNFGYLRNGKLSHAIPESAFAALECERDSARQYFANRLNSPILSLLERTESIRMLSGHNQDYRVPRADHHQTKFCLKDALTVAGYYRELNRLGLGTFKWSIPIKDQLASLAQFNSAAVNLDSELDARSNSCLPTNRCPACVIDFSHEVNGIISAVLSRCTGLCIDCTLKIPATPNNCRMHHTEPLLFQVRANDVLSFAHWTEEDIQRLHR
ncbi:hypothetical protein W97_03830 [Coniosporium apollinis CBS 100218]|uniref:BTB domain-containing protein n=1 Tax=Coniosporium apollinis (strain CBS 100218) TaxID=1168221 RepID=R7YRS1_CONA1|nr:uncharacterized protein W97_03830 [Coniosporium apollinis CBS 100218]EON64597.1 hypothetical protein W97_03830 [Coniosporium apollinis CBS 100218]